MTLAEGITLKLNRSEDGNISVTESKGLFAFWDNEEKAIVIATHGIVKKTQKTPSKEIKKAEEIMKLYYKLKNEKGTVETI